jgi:hypothetical protein
MHSLAMPTPDGAPFIAHCQTPAAAQPPALEHIAPVFRFHPMQESVLSAARYALGLPCSLRHNVLFLICRSGRNQRRHIIFTTTGVRCTPRPL